MARSPGLEPGTHGLAYHYSFRYHRSVCGLDYLSTISHWDLGHSRLVSTPSSFEAWLGIAILKVSPNLRVYATYCFQYEAPIA